MSVKIAYQKAKTADEAYSLIKEKITPDYMNQFKFPANVEYDPSKKCIKAVGQGFTLTLSFQSSDCHIDLDLSFLLKPLRGKILGKVEDQLKNHL